MTWESYIEFKRASTSVSSFYFILKRRIIASFLYIETESSLHVQFLMHFFSMFIQNSMKIFSNIVIVEVKLKHVFAISLVAINLVSNFSNWFRLWHWHWHWHWCTDTVEVPINFDEYQFSHRELHYIAQCKQKLNPNTQDHFNDYFHCFYRQFNRLNI